MQFIGIDPGVHGAVAHVEDDDVVFYDMPVLVMTSKSAGKLITRRKVDVAEFYETLRQLDAPICGIEDLSARPGKGSIASFSLGRSMGAMEMAAYASRLSAMLVPPNVWKRHFGFPVGDKDAPRLELLSLLGPRDDLRLKSKHQDRADAYWIGRYAAEQSSTPPSPLR